MRTVMKLLCIPLILLLAACSNSSVQAPGGEHRKEIESASRQPDSLLQTQSEPRTGDVLYDMQGREEAPTLPGGRALERNMAGSSPAEVTKKGKAAMFDPTVAPSPAVGMSSTAPVNTESYTPRDEQGFIATANDPLSTFSIDVDTASYSNIRRFIAGGTLPPVDAVRIEEMINYFSYRYPEPAEGPFSLTTEVGPCPWNRGSQVVRIGLKAKNLRKKDLPPSNFVFLIDVSGSMNQPNKLPLLKRSLKMLVDQLDGDDRVAIVVYAGADRVVLQPLPGDRKREINQAIDSLQAGGMTHGARGILSAYEMAERTRLPHGNNRVILASDGDFNVGVTSRGELIRLIEDKRRSGIYLTVLGFGMGNYHDDTMEVLADKGNGNYAYIDSLLEAKKVLVKEMSGSMFALANDVKIQVEFNPARVGAYRLIGYENRALADEDFNNDKKDAGEIGPDHTVTALYEIIPAGGNGVPVVDPLKYRPVRRESETLNNELLTVKVRYKPWGKETSALLEKAVEGAPTGWWNMSDDFRFATAVAGFGMWLQHSASGHGCGPADILQIARGAKGEDREGYRAEFIRLVEAAELLRR